MTTNFQYATIELMPYPEQGEFVIVGVLAVSDKGEVAANIMREEDSQRLTQFFPEIDQEVFASALKTAHTSVCRDRLDDGATDGKAVFQVLTSNREGLIRVTERGAGTTDDLDQWLNDAYNRIVLRVRGPGVAPTEAEGMTSR